MSDFRLPFRAALVLGGGGGGGGSAGGVAGKLPQVTVCAHMLTLRRLWC